MKFSCKGLFCFIRTLIKRKSGDEMNLLIIALRLHLILQGLINAHKSGPLFFTITLPSKMTASLQLYLSIVNDFHAFLHTFLMPMIFFPVFSERSFVAKIVDAIIPCIVILFRCSAFSVTEESKLK